MSGATMVILLSIKHLDIRTVLNFTKEIIILLFVRN